MKVSVEQESRSNVRIEQLVHGYRRGHTLLASSTNLSKEDLEVTRRLSDLSGPLPSSEHLDPYFTLYPLNTGKYYAVGKTWMDLNAPRPGCVLTHTLLVPVNSWRTTSSPERFADLCRMPEKEDVEGYSKSISMDAIEEGHEEERESSQAKLETVLDFTWKYFEQGLSPIIWFDERNSDALMWSIVKFLWPELRARFACCTQTLQKRSLKERDFDLMFAPRTRASNFELPPKHFINFGGTGKRIQHEFWCDLVAEGILRPESQAAADLRNRIVFSKLGEQPTSLRLVFVYQDLERKIAESPTAALGLLDVLESLAPDKSQAVDEKSRTIESALVASERMDEPEERVTFVFGIHQRLRTECFSLVEESVRRTFASVVAAYTAQAPAKALGFIEQLLAPTSSELASPFVLGVVDGLHLFASRDAERFVELLDEHKGILSQLIEVDCRLVVDYYLSLKSHHRSSTDLLIGLLQASTDVTRKRMRELLLPVLSVGDVQLVYELLRDAGDDEVSVVLHTLEQSNSEEGLFELVAERLSVRQSEAMRSWAIHQLVWKDRVAFAYACSYERSKSGCESLLANSELISEQISSVLVYFLDKSIAEGRTEWFTDVFLSKPHTIKLLVDAATSASDHMARVVERIVSHIDRIDLAESHFLFENMQQGRQSRFTEIMLGIVVRSMVSGFVAGDVSRSEYEFWLSKESIERTLEQIDTGDLRRYLCDRHEQSGMTYARSLEWLSIAPSIFYSNRSLDQHELVQLIVSRARYSWTVDVTDHWAGVLRRVDRESSEHSAMRSFVYAVDFAFRNRHLPVSEILIVSFERVYEAVAAERFRSEIDGLFGFFSWDRCKELREKLIESFRRSDWPPGDLALSVTDSDLRRKIIKRLLETSSGGHRYLKRMQEDLSVRTSEVAQRAYKDISVISKRGDWTEDWF